MWAQRPKHIMLNVCLTDVKDPVIKVEPNKLYFKERNNDRIYSAYLNFF